MISYKDKHFLVADDFPDFRAAVKSMLTQIGVRSIDIASSGEESVSMCRKKRYDVIVHDYNLGEGKDGMQVLEELVLEELLSPHTVFIMATAENSQSYVMGAMEYEPDAYLTKPFNRAALQQRLDALLERKEALRTVNDALAAKDWAAVVEAVDKLIAEKSRYALYAFKSKAKALKALGRDDEFTDMLTGLINERMVPWALLELGKHQLTKGLLDEAEETFQRAINQYPMLPAFKDGLAEVKMAEGDALGAQTLLQEAVKASPRSLLRQTRLGELAKTNKDYEQATRAFRQAVSLGRTSCLKNPDNYLNLSTVLNAQIGGGGMGEKRMQEEAARILSEVEKDYENNRAVQARTRLLEAQLLTKQGKKSDAEKLVRDGLTLMGQLDQSLSPEVAMDVAAQLRELGRGDEAQEVLSQCAEMFGDDANVQSLLAQQPGSEALLEKANTAKQLNRQAIKLYEQAKIPEALKLFREALDLQSRNISIVLNCAQALIKLSGKGENAEALDECRACLDRVKAIPESDPRYARYQQLRALVARRSGAAA